MGQEIKAKLNITSFFHTSRINLKTVQLALQENRLKVINHLGRKITKVVIYKLKAGGGKRVILIM